MSFSAAQLAEPERSWQELSAKLGKHLSAPLPPGGSEAKQMTLANFFTGPASETPLEVWSFPSCPEISVGKGHTTHCPCGPTGCWPFIIIFLIFGNC